MGTLMQTINTRRLTLRPYQQTDAARVAYLAGDYDVAKMCGRVPHPYSIAAAYSFFRSFRTTCSAGIPVTPPPPWVADDAWYSPRIGVVKSA